MRTPSYAEPASDGAYRVIGSTMLPIRPSAIAMPIAAIGQLLGPVLAQPG